jgi:hypothetical protein
MPFNLISQTDTLKLSLDNSVSALYNTQSSSNQTSFSYSGNNTLSYNKFQFNTTTSYQLVYNKSIISNELLEKTNISRSSLFLSHIYNYSLSRKIISDHSVGFGYSKKWNINNLTLGLSYAILSQRTDYSDKQDILITRHSARFKLKYSNSIISFLTEIYFQPNIKSYYDKIIYGSTKLIIKPKAKLNIAFQDAINYRSLSSVKLIHNLTVGLSYQFEKTKVFSED